MNQSRLKRKTLIRHITERNERLNNEYEISFEQLYFRALLGMFKKNDVCNPITTITS